MERIVKTYEEWMGKLSLLGFGKEEEEDNSPPDPELFNNSLIGRTGKNIRSLLKKKKKPIQKDKDDKNKNEEEINN